MTCNNCNGGPDACGGCCACMELQARHAIDQLREENELLRSKDETCRGCGHPIAECVAGWDAPDAGGCSGNWPGRDLFVEERLARKKAEAEVRRLRELVTIHMRECWGLDGLTDDRIAGEVLKDEDRMLYEAVARGGGTS